MPAITFPASPYTNQIFTVEAYILFGQILKDIMRVVGT